MSGTGLANMFGVSRQVIVQDIALLRAENKDVIIDDGVQQRCITLNRPYKGLLIVPGIWRVINNFSSGSVCLVMASEHYDEDDYVRDYEEFKRLTKNKITNEIQLP